MPLCVDICQVKDVVPVNQLLYVRDKLEMVPRPVSGLPGVVANTTKEIPKFKCLWSKGQLAYHQVAYTSI
jgi:hypothetical protein